MSSRSIESQVISGCRVATAWIFAIVTSALFAGGVKTVFFPGPIRPGSLMDRYSPIAEWLFLIIPTAVMIVTMNRWVKALPGIFIYGVYRSLGMIAGSDSANARLEALIIMLYSAASTALSLTFGGRKLNLVDRAALLAFVFSFAWMVARDSTRSIPTGRRTVPADFTTYAAMGIGVLCLLIAWAYDRIQRRRTHGRQTPRPDHAEA